jgi:decaprenylphospho-beta-D-ribofuranose 2-oxidase
MSAPDSTHTPNGLHADVPPVEGRPHVRASLPGGRRLRLSGWGRTDPCEATVLRPQNVEQACEAVLMAGARGGLIARGAGRSYGDAAQNGGGLVADLTRLREVEILRAPEPLVRAGAGATLAQAMQALAPLGLTLPVVPGTRHVTIGGAIAADIHGKNHRRDGSFGHHVQSVLLCTPDGTLHEISRERESDLFHATLGGMGLTGVILEATVRPSPAGAPLLDGDIDRTDTLTQAMEVMAAEDAHRYSIAWTDLRSRGRAFGRSVVLRSNLRPLGEAAGAGPAGAGSAGTGAKVHLPGRPRLRVPEGFPAWVLSGGAVQLFNTLRWRRAPRSARGVPITTGENFFPLDALGSWNRLYGTGGLLQYQFVVPEQRRDALIEVLERLRAARQPMYLAVVKRFGEGSGGLLSFPMPGWTLAVDLPAASPGLRAVLDATDELLAAVGGRVYLAKDSRLRAELLWRMYPQLERFNEIRRAIDPDGVMRSDLACRLRLAGDRQAAAGRGASRQREAAAI